MQPNRQLCDRAICFYKIIKVISWGIVTTCILVRHDASTTERGMMRAISYVSLHWKEKLRSQLLSMTRCIPES